MSVGSLQREIRLKKSCDKYASLREKLRQIKKNKNLPLSERMLARSRLFKLPRSSMRIRQSNRCALTGRTRAYDRRTGLCKFVLRQQAGEGKLPGFRRASF